MKGRVQLTVSSGEYEVTYTDSSGNGAMYSGLGPSREAAVANLLNRMTNLRARASADLTEALV